MTRFKKPKRHDPVFKIDTTYTAVYGGTHKGLDFRDNCAEFRLSVSLYMYATSNFFLQTYLKSLRSSLHTVSFLVGNPGYLGILQLHILGVYYSCIKHHLPFFVSCHFSWFNILHFIDNFVVNPEILQTELFPFLRNKLQ